MMELRAGSAHMKSLRPNDYVLLVFAVIVALIFGVGTRPLNNEGAQANTNTRLIRSLEGPDVFRAHCAACHGGQGKGDGPVAPALVTRPPDLTTISRRNGGNYPADRIGRTIEGEEDITAHGTREMPIWGPIFHQVEEDRDYGDVRLHNVVEYIRSIQQK
jgi:mono/diheme cytochrome c family protein